MVQRSWHFAAALALTCALAVPPAARAQLWPNRMRNAGLPPGDLKIASETARTLYESATAAVGQSRRWSNPATGSDGRTTLVGAPTLRGLSCRTIRYDFHMIKPDRTSTYTINWCRTPAGDWKTVR